MNERQGLRETALVLRYQAGDASAIEPLVEQYDGRLRYFVRRLLGNGTDERDIMQDVWLKAIRGLPRLRDPSLLAPWLYRIARNKVYNHLRDRKIHHPVSDEDLAVEDDPAAPLHAAHTAARVHECLMQLNPIHREALLLRFLQDMPYDAMAHVMACGVGTVRSRLHYAKRALRTLLEEDGHAVQG